MHKYLRHLETLVIEICGAFRVAAGTRDGFTGVWVGGRKIASIGVGVRRWVSMHGFALNVTKESLAAFAHITPCGIDGVEMTCLEAEGAAGVSVKAVADWIAAHSSFPVEKG